jgi:hypothetical protein
MDVQVFLQRLSLAYDLVTGRTEFVPRTELLAAMQEIDHLRANCQYHAAQVSSYQALIAKRAPPSPAVITSHLFVILTELDSLLALVQQAQGRDAPRGEDTLMRVESKLRQFHKTVSSWRAKILHASGGYC